MVSYDHYRTSDARALCIKTDTMSVPATFATQPNVYHSIERMLQGLAFWMGYKIECYAKHSPVEAVVVDAAVGLLNAHLNHCQYAVCCEYNYRKIVGGKANARADVTIVDTNNNPVCVIEFKLSTNSNGGLKSDISKLRSFRGAFPRIIIFLSRKDNKMVSWLLHASKAKQSNDGIRIRRSVCAYKSAKTSKNIIRAFCIEVL